MKIASLALIAASLVLTGCASVEMASKDESTRAKQFSAPSANNAGLYVYRNSNLGAALKKDVWVDGKCIGESAPHTFFFTEIEGGKVHKLSTESEFSPNDLDLTAIAGKNYFVRQYIKMGAFVGGANLELMTEEDGKKDIAKIELAKSGNCSGPRTGSAPAAVAKPVVVASPVTAPPMAQQAIVAMQQPVPQPVVVAQQPAPIVPLSRALDAYEEALAEMRAKHNRLNPDSIYFNQDVLDWVMARKAEHMQKGLSAPAALRRAVENMERP
jgi:hypothetical protein